MAARAIAELGGYSELIVRGPLPEYENPNDPGSARPARRPRIFVSGPTAVVGRAADLLVPLGHEPVRIRVEDFGPMGG